MKKPKKATKRAGKRSGPSGVRALLGARGPVHEVRLCYPPKRNLGDDGGPPGPRYDWGGVILYQLEMHARPFATDGVEIIPCSLCGQPVRADDLTCWKCAAPVDTGSYRDPQGSVSAIKLLREQLVRIGRADQAVRDYLQRHPGADRSKASLALASDTEPGWHLYLPMALAAHFPSESVPKDEPT